MFPTDTKILVADDSRVMRLMIVNTLKELGYSDITDVDNGADAYHTLLRAANERPFQLVFSDQNMPMVSGTELLQKIRVNPDLKNITFIMITSETPKAMILQLVAEGAANVIAKPFNVETIRKKLELVYQRVQRAAQN